MSSGRSSTGSTSASRAVAGFLISPYLATLLTLILTMLAMGWGHPVSDWNAKHVAIGFAVMPLLALIGSPVAYLGMLVIGLPTWLVLRFTNNESGLAYTLVGVLGGAVAGPLVGGQKLHALPMTLLGAVAGGLALFIFWQVSKQRVG